MDDPAHLTVQTYNASRQAKIAVRIMVDIYDEGCKHRVHSNGNDDASMDCTFDES